MLYVVMKPDDVDDDDDSENEMRISFQACQIGMKTCNENDP